MNAREIRILKNKFVGISMLSFALVIISIGILINVVNYTVTQREIRYSLKEILERKDTIEEEDNSVRQLPKPPMFTKVFLPSYQNNTFYIITYNENGTESSFYASKGNTFPQNIISEDARLVLQSTSDQGWHGLYYYQKIRETDGSTVLVIMDGTQFFYARMRLLYASIVVGAVGLLTTWFLVILFSRKMIRPEIENNVKQIQFLTNVSHELKTPLSVIRSNAEMEELCKGESEWMQSTIRQVDRMNGLVKSLVMITKTREKEEKRTWGKTNLSMITEETVKEFSAMAESSHKNLQARIEQDLVVFGDESGIRQLVLILLDNAIKYCDADGTITVSAGRMKSGKRSVRLTITNTYADGKDVDCRRFFDRFYREDKAHNIDTGGYGIGLSVAEYICEKFHGRIYAEWKEGVIGFFCELV